MGGAYSRAETTGRGAGLGSKQRTRELSDPPVILTKGFPRTEGRESGWQRGRGSLCVWKRHVGGLEGVDTVLILDPGVWLHSLYHSSLNCTLTSTDFSEYAVFDNKSREKRDQDVGK